MRDIKQLHPDVQKLAKQLVKECKKHGLKIKITDCLRTKAEQDALSSTVTTVKYPNSYHAWGLAFDICRADGKGAYYDKDNFFAKVGAIGVELGLEWGGNWISFKDRPHFQYTKLGRRNVIQAKYGTPKRFLAHFDIAI
jgi:peptidoglycan L-alanyl-D-glutamate endopeptidase CwlK